MPFEKPRGYAKFKKITGRGGKVKKNIESSERIGSRAYSHEEFIIYVFEYYFAGLDNNLLC